MFGVNFMENNYQRAAYKSKTYQKPDSVDGFIESGHNAMKMGFISAAISILALLLVTAHIVS
jgi:hypothetical protein